MAVDGLPLDKLFYEEFGEMMRARRSIYGNFNIYTSNLIPKGAEKLFMYEKRPKLVINNITDDYYSKLNGSECIELSRGGTTDRRKFDSSGAFIVKGGVVQVEHIPVPHNCVVVASKIRLGVPLKYKPNEDFMYVDYKDNTNPNALDRDRRYIYIIPRKYCFRVKKTALILTTNKVNAHYGGVLLSGTSGTTLRLYIVDYHKAGQTQRVLCSKSSIDYHEQVNLLLDYWVKTGVIFSPRYCKLDSILSTKNSDIENLAYIPISPTLDTYVRYDETKSLEGDAEVDTDFGFVD